MRTLHHQFLLKLKWRHGQGRLLTSVLLYNQNTFVLSVLYSLMINSINKMTWSFLLLTFYAKFMFLILIFVSFLQLLVFSLCTKC